MTTTTSGIVLTSSSSSSNNTNTNIPGHIVRFFCSTIPFLIVLVYLLYKAWERPQLASQAAELAAAAQAEAEAAAGDDDAAANQNNNNNNQNYYDVVSIDEGGIFSLMDILLVFLTFHVLWTFFVIYLIIFIPKRRHFLGRYLQQEDNSGGNAAAAETSLGDVIYDTNSRKFCGGGSNNTWCCGGGNCCPMNMSQVPMLSRSAMHDYGYALYAHPTQPNKVVRKRVRVYQPYTRERITIVRLPNRPLSGQAKIDIEIDLKQMREERDVSLRWITFVGLFWIIFTLVGSIYVIRQMDIVESHGDLLAFNENTSLAIRLFWVVIGLNIPLGYAINWVRFLFYHNWMVNRAAIVEDETSARKIDPICLKASPSEDDSDRIPYSLILGDSVSYQGTLPSYQQHQRSLSSKPPPPSSSSGGGVPPPPLLGGRSNGNNRSYNERSHRSFRTSSTTGAASASGRNDAANRTLA